MKLSFHTALHIHHYGFYPRPQCANILGSLLQMVLTTMACWIIRSITVGTPPLSLRIFTLHTGNGLYLPFLMLSNSSSLLLFQTRKCFVYGHSIYSACLRLQIQAALDFILNREIVRFKHALYIVSVLSAHNKLCRSFAVRTLFQPPHPTSFRFHLSIDTLNSSYCDK